MRGAPYSECGGIRVHSELIPVDSFKALKQRGLLGKCERMDINLVLVTKISKEIPWPVCASLCGNIYIISTPKSASWNTKIRSSLGWLKVYCPI